MPARRPISHDPDLRWCSQCQGFRPRTDFLPNHATKDGLSVYCRPHNAEARRKSYLRHIDKARNRNLKTCYGIGMDDYQALHQAQQGRCAICHEVPSGTFKGHPVRLHVDHCHQSGRVRGLLCKDCNTALGNLKDDPAILENAIAYLANHSDPSRA